MNWWQRFRKRAELENELDAELRFHFARQAADNIRKGMTEEEARRRARLEFGGLDQLKEDCRDARGTLWVETTLQDIRLALRTLRKSPGFAAAAIVTLALGIGANTAIFSVVYAVLLRPLPYATPAQLVLVSAFVPQLRSRFPSLPVRATDFQEFRRSNTVFSGMAALRSQDFNLTGTGEPERLYGARVSANLFSLLGVQPERGRSFAPEEDEPGRDRVVVISHDLWVRRFGADLSILNRPLSLDGQSYTVVGIMPAGLLFPTGTQLHPFVSFGPRVDVWKPMAFTARELQDSGSWNYAVIARLKSGMAVAQAQQEMTALAGPIGKRIPNLTVDLRAQVVPLSEVFSGKVRQGLLVLLGSVALLLVIACVNLANLLLARMSARGREFATRAALGASRWRLARQFLTESSVVASLGAVAGLFIAYGGTRLLVSLWPADSPAARSSQLNGPVLLFTVAVALATGLAFGLVPAFEAARGELHGNLASRGAASGRRADRFRRLLVAVEVALSTGLLVVAGLLLHSFVKVMSVDKGFAVERILAADLSLPAKQYSRERGIAFYRELAARVRALPGVMAAGAVSASPSGRNSETSAVYLDTDTKPTLDRPMAVFQGVTKGYFAAVEIPLLTGRWFEDQEPAPVAVISAGLARKLWPGERLSDVVGRRLQMGAVNTAPATVVGVAGDVRAVTLEHEPLPAVYQPQIQSPSQDMTLVVRTAQEPQTLASAVRNQVWKLDRNLPVASMQTMREIVSASTAPRRFQMILIMLFAALSLSLAVVGIYGVTSYSVARRTQEIGLRMALGAQQADVLKSVLMEGLRPVLLGLAVGLIAAGIAAAAIRSLLFGIGPLDPLALGAVCFILLAAATLACYVPARRASGVDPVIALRSE